ncbi:uncharacterized protein N7496_007002 [Penicillium cataractarum]|uniref:Uncharacterized protein n=1 Tax=Penicillium cataractarum TaxID=2100454 RepID=A0A9W9S2W6_9EURO|nr:uncharacterized protein N7496_007002 [Penicillium cataractarum]KAJ5370910.1 hypothetical protein N7496_007002 [Penicillium cataractarum]
MGASRHSDPRTGDYEGWRIATVDCLELDDRDYDVRGVRIWMNSEQYYIILGVPLFVGDAVAEMSFPSNVSKEWDQDWASYTTAARDDAGYTAEDTNIYYVKGNGEECLRGLREFTRRVQEGVLAKGYDSHRYYGVVMYSQIMAALVLHDPTWQHSRNNLTRQNEEEREQWEKDHAKDIVHKGPSFRVLRDGTTVHAKIWGFYT